MSKIFAYLRLPHPSLSQFKINANKPQLMDSVGPQNTGAECVSVYAFGMASAMAFGAQLFLRNVYKRALRVYDSVPQSQIIFLVSVYRWGSSLHLSCEVHP